MCMNIYGYVFWFIRIHGFDGQIRKERKIFLRGGGGGGGVYYREGKRGEGGLYLLSSGSLPKHWFQYLLTQLQQSVSEGFAYAAHGRQALDVST